MRLIHRRNIAAGAIAILIVAFLSMGSALAMGLFSPPPAPLPLKGQWTATSRLYQTAPQSYSLDVSVGPFNYKAPWKGISAWTEIVPGWAPDTAPWAWKSTQAEYDVRLKSDVTSGEVIEWSRNGLYVRLQPMALNWTNDLSQIQQISMPQSVPLSLEGLKAGWPNAYGAGRSLYFQLGNVDLQKQLILSSPLPPPPAFIINGGNPRAQLNFIFDYSNALTLVVNGANWNGRDEVTTVNEIAFKDSTGQSVYYWRKPVAWDALGNTVTPIVRLKKSGSSLYVSVETPYTWLLAATFPITIDPTLDLQVGASADDVWVRVANTSSPPHTWTARFLTSAIQLLGEDSSFFFGMGVRFLNVALEGTDTIDVAYMTMNPDQTQSGTVVRSNIYGEDADDAATYSTVANFNGRVRTAAVVADGLGTWTLDTPVNSPSIVAPVTTIKNRAGWASGNAMAFMWEDDGSDDQAHRRVDTWDANTTLAAKLHIEYTVGAEPTPTPTPTPTPIPSGSYGAII